MSAKVIQINDAQGINIFHLFSCFSNSSTFSFISSLKTPGTSSSYWAISIWSWMYCSRDVEIGMGICDILDLGIEILNLGGSFVQSHYHWTGWRELL